MNLVAPAPGPNRFGRVMVVASALLVAWAAPPACRQADSPPEPAAPSAPGRPPSGWVDTAPPEDPPTGPSTAEQEQPPARPPPPAAPAPSHSATNMTPWSNLHPDQWACYGMLNGYVQRLTVRSCGPEQVELVMEMFYHGDPLGLPAGRIENRRELSPLAEAKHRQATIVFAEDEITAAGQTWLCLRATARWQEEGQDYEQNTWICPQAPLSGLVLQETRLESRLIARAELVSFGRNGSRGPACP